METPTHSAVIATRRPWRRRLIVWGLILASGVGYSIFWRYHLKRFQAVAPGTFYRVGQPTELGLRHLVRHHGIRTVVSLQLFDPRLHRGLYDFDRADGEKESEFVRSLGARAVQWPQGDEACWPWPNAWQLEEFFRLIDDPANRPVVIHCMGGRHRTGTLSALYRLEYDRWTAAQALEEMYSFMFGGAIPVQETNLKTYCPRPLPEDANWPGVAETFGESTKLKAADAVPVLVHRIRASKPDDALRRTFEAFATSNHDYALPLASRVVQDVHDPLLTVLLPKARKVVESGVAAQAQAAAAAVLIADFGSPGDQQALLAAIERESKSAAPTENYEGLVRGVTNRYTSNRLPFLRPVLDDARMRLGFADVTYRVTAACRVAGITNAIKQGFWTADQLDGEAVPLAIEWFRGKPEALHLAQLTAPQGKRQVQSGDGANEEDLSKMRR